MDKQVVVMPFWQGWGLLVVILFFLIALSAIAMIFAPIKLHIVRGPTQDTDIVWAPSAISQEGLKMRVEAWKEYPEYNFGFGSIAVIAFTGALCMIKFLYSLRDEEGDALQSISRQV